MFEFRVSHSIFKRAGKASELRATCQRNTSTTSKSLTYEAFSWWKRHASVLRVPCFALSLAASSSLSSTNWPNLRQTDGLSSGSRVSFSKRLLPLQVHGTAIVGASSLDFRTSP